MALIQSRVSDELKEAFSNHCLNENTTEAKLLRRTIKKLLSTSTSFDEGNKPEKILKTNQIKR